MTVPDVAVRVKEMRSEEKQTEKIFLQDKSWWRYERGGGEVFHEDMTFHCMIEDQEQIQT